MKDTVSEFEILPADEVPNDPVWIGRHSVYRFAQMEVGTAFKIPADHPAAQATANGRSARASNAAYEHGRRYGKEFSCRRQRDGSVRIERIA